MSKLIVRGRYEVMQCDITLVTKLLNVSAGSFVHDWLECMSAMVAYNKLGRMMAEIYCT